MSETPNAHGHAHYTRRPSSSASMSPLAGATRSVERRTSRGEVEAMSESPAPRPTPSSRMALSALVNSPPVSPPKPHQQREYRSPSPLPAHHHSSHSTQYPPARRGSGSREPRYAEDPYSRVGFPSASTSNEINRSYHAGSSSAYPPRHTLERSYSGRSYEGSQNGYEYDDRAHRRMSAHTVGSDVDRRPHSRSRSPVKQPIGSMPMSAASSGAGGYWSNGLVHPSQARRRQVKLTDMITGSEDLWEEALKKYQAKREAEVAEIESWVPEVVKGKPGPKPRKSVAADIETSSVAGSIGPDGEPSKRKGGSGKTKKKKKAPQVAAIEDELLGLAEGGEASSPLPASEAYDDEDDETGHARDSSMAVGPAGPETLLASGLTRAQVIAKIEANNLKGLSEADVKAVQDEMWANKKEATGGGGANLIRKDGTMRRKPGPAKGWKKLRRNEAAAAAGGSGSVKGEDSEAENASMVDERSHMGDADAEIAALLEDGHPSKRSKRRRLAEGEEATRFASEDHMGFYDSDEERRYLAAQPPVGSKKKKGKSRAKTAIVDPSDPAEEGGWAPGMEYTGEQLAQMARGQEEEPRGVSADEAVQRAAMVEDLQRNVWAAVCRDVPRVYRVYQGYDTIAKQDALRRVQAVIRNAFSQRPMKPTYRSQARMNKEAGTKGRRVIKEMLLYWRKNEKDELAARKKAEKEALEKAKAEEEAREAKRQARKLNFLLTQTELYSHFIGKKIKTAEAEQGDADTADSAAAPPAPKGAEHINEELGLDANGEVLPDIDYDDDDEENLRKHAARGAQAAVQAARDKAAAFDKDRVARDTAAAAQPIDLDGDELNFQNPSLGENALTITQPKMLMAQLKEYQLKGLTWLGNLYEQGINGILADEMGLGKTIQSISLLAYLAEHHNLWGPFLVIAPSSTLHNWQQELARFVPKLKTLPYWGSPKDRETLRKIWNRKNMTFNEDSPFHILVTSYQLAVQDEKYFQMTRWQYMILDEAQAIKSSSSARWKSLLSLHCRNRLLLTGTPIQNSMHELWALLHFIMPSLFDSHEEFSEWFSKDIENAAGGGSGTLKPEQLRRLHMILKPFMLRRVKKHVQKELGDKIEIDVLVDLSQRQRAIYKALRQRVSISDLIAQANNLTDSLGAKNLMNLVMQFRKVCNHPDLFERADVVSPYVFGSFSHSGNLAREPEVLYCPDSGRNAIPVTLPRLIWDESLDRPSEESKAGSERHVLDNLLNIWSPEWITRSMQEKKEQESGFGWMKILDVNPAEASRRAKANPLVTMLREAGEEKENLESGPIASDSSFAASSALRLPPLAPRIPDTRPPSDTALRDITISAWNRSYLSRSSARFATESAVAPLLVPDVSSRSFVTAQSRLREDPLVRKIIYGPTPSERADPSALHRLESVAPNLPPVGLIGASDASELPLPAMRVPSLKRLIVDSAKLARLDELLRELKDGGHRVLLYFQMTKMMDLVEEYLIYRQYKYLRLDGSSAIGDRRDMVTSWQTNPDIFVFCLSTRAGGLGINLTAADTVVFYDHDWNPSNDAQAMDRAHRVGQTKQVTVYRLIARGTIEERIVKLARAKKDVQDIVVGTKSLTDVAKPSEIVSLFMDDEELAESVAKRKQAEEHGYVAPTVTLKPKSAFGDSLGIDRADDDEDDFFSLKKRPANNEDEDFGDETKPAANGAAKKKKAKPKVSVANGDGGEDGAPGSAKKKKSGVGKRKDPPGDGESPAKPTPKKKKVKIALGPDGLPL